MNRKGFLWRFAGVVFAGMISLPSFLKNYYSNHAIRRSEFHCLFPKLDSGPVLQKHAPELGRDYLSRHSATQSESKLLSELKRFETPNKYEATLTSISNRSRLPVSEALQATIRHDFETRQTVNLRGWVLSETEAKLCALYVMST